MRSSAVAGRWNSANSASRNSPALTVWVMNIRKRLCGKKFDFLSDHMKQLEGRMAEVAQLSAEYATLLA